MQSVLIEKVCHIAGGILNNSLPQYHAEHKEHLKEG